MKQYVLTDKKAARRLMRALKAPTDRDMEFFETYERMAENSFGDSAALRLVSLNRIPETVRLAANTVITDGGDAYCNRAIHRCHVDMDIISVVDLDSEQANLYRVSTYGPLAAANEK